MLDSQTNFVVQDACFTHQMTRISLRNPVVTSTLTKSFLKLSPDHRRPGVLIMGIFDYKTRVFALHFCLGSGPDLVLNLYLTYVPKICSTPLP